MKLLLRHNLTDPRFAFFVATLDFLRSQGIDHVDYPLDADIALYCANMGFNYHLSSLSHFWSEDEPYSRGRDMRNVEWLANRVESIIGCIRDLDFMSLCSGSVDCTLDTV